MSTVEEIDKQIEETRGEGGKGAKRTQRECEKNKESEKCKEMKKERDKAHDKKKELNLDKKNLKGKQRREEIKKKNEEKKKKKQNDFKF